MITSTVTKVSDKPKFKYPLLATSKETGNTVLFISDTTGTVVNFAGGSYSLGYYATSWASVEHPGSCWTVLNSGSNVNLTQE